MARRDADPKDNQEPEDRPDYESATQTDENLADELGAEAGVSYEEGEPIHTVDKVQSRDDRRWELDPASSEDFDARSRDPIADE
jgi:hypothetical protein